MINQLLPFSVNQSLLNILIAFAFVCCVIAYVTRLNNGFVFTDLTRLLFSKVLPDEKVEQRTGEKVSTFIFKYIQPALFILLLFHENVLLQRFGILGILLFIIYLASNYFRKPD